VSRPGKGLFVRRKHLSGTPVQNIQTPPRVSIISCVYVCCFVKSITIHRKIQK
jgi:hypothetical protein